MNVSWQFMLGVMQILVSLVTLLGVAFAAGRFSARFDAVERAHEEIKDALFGGDGQRGTFLRRAEAELLAQENRREHERIFERVEALEMERGGGV